MPKPAPSTTSAPSHSRTLAKKIRDLERLLSLDSLPATTRRDKERALESLKDQKRQNLEQITSKKMGGKYKLVKFVEHQKALRFLSKAQKALSSLLSTNHESHDDDDDDEERDEEEKEREEVMRAREEVKRREIEVAYIETFPEREKYISLYKQINQTPGSQKSRDRRARLLEEVEARVTQSRTGEKGSTRENQVTQDVADVTGEEEGDHDDFFE